MADRSRFEHLFVELSVACGTIVPRYRLWLALCDAGANPEALRRREALAFCDARLASFLGAHELSLSSWRRWRLRRAVSLFDPALTTPSEILERLHPSDDPGDL